MGCAACHKIGDFGGTIGPDLSALGSGLSPERIATEVLWPMKQVKEGFSLTRLTFNDNRVVQGYLQRGRDNKLVLLRDFASGEIHEIPADGIRQREDLGSLMPPTAQSLSRGELADLLSYLAGLRG